MPHDWLQTINALLLGEGEEHREARAQIWIEVEDYVLRRAVLPIGPLGDDEEERRDIFLQVMRKLERNDYAHLRRWKTRQQQRRDEASWWGFIKVVTRCAAIDRARTSPRNLAPRGQPFRWAIVEPTAPDATETITARGSFVEMEPSVVRFLAHCTEAELIDFLSELNRVRARARMLEQPEPPETPVTTRRSQGR